MSKIFICYSRQDQAFARRLYKTLQENGMSPWMDQFDIQAGQHWDRTVDKALHECSILLLVHTAASAASENPWDEWSFFRDRKKPIIPLLVENVELSHQLARLQYVDFCTQPFDEAIKQLLEAIPVHDPTPEPNGSALQSRSHGVVVPSHDEKIDQEQLIAAHDPFDRYTWFGYDNLNRLTQTICSSTDHSGQTSFVFDLLGQTKSGGNNTLPLERYDAAGYLTSTPNTDKNMPIGEAMNHEDGMDSPSLAVSKFSPLENLSKQRIRHG